MFKKIIALSLTFALLAPIGAVQAADHEASTPTLEEILNEYHQKAFQEQATGISLCSDGKTLEAETVEALNNAGYEAYYVTDDNYDSLETTLQADFSAMGLSKDSSYIVTFGIENPSGDKIEIDDGGLGGGSASSFFYEYNGTDYLMRYVTVTAASDAALSQTSAVELNTNELPNGVETVCRIIADRTVLGHVWSLLDIIESNLPTGVDTVSNSIIYQACSVWNMQYLQIFDASTAQWLNAASTEYVSQACYVHYTYYDADFNQYLQESAYHFLGNSYAKYYDTDSIKQLATIAFAKDTVYYDYLMTVKYAQDDVVVITHQRHLYAGVSTTQLSLF